MWFSLWHLLYVALTFQIDDDHKINDLEFYTWKYYSIFALSYKSSFKIFQKLGKYPGGCT